MLPKEIKRQIRRLKSNDPEEQQDAFWILMFSQDQQAILETLETIEKLGNWPLSGDPDSLAWSWSIEPMQGVVLPLVKYLEKSPLSNVGRDCAYILGTLSYIEGSLKRCPETRIVPSLVRIAESILPDGLYAITPMLYALRECSKVRSVEAAEHLARKALELSFQENAFKEDVFPELTIIAILEILYSNNPKTRLFKELRALVKGQPRVKEPAKTIREFLRKKEKMSGGELQGKRPKNEA
ncbi:hypothetical protein K9N68_19745 [Kovacikia minuta CCNUW1]|uniref:hypothetical protein n=1 Tax=Kovacikia minuta TaxID=2931930 RepID=UPI001CCD7B65|nr:hypothetical protein [Kovacikia minuta]UBF23966.1 hypothetical protein K9N68_19745 [Kovacikia minuta CCNUW1]